MQELKAKDDAGNEELGLVLLEPSSAAHMVPQIAPFEQIHGQIEFFPILKSVGHVDNKRMPELGKQFSLIQNRMDTFLGDDLGFVHFLHRVNLSRLLHFHRPDLAEAALPYHVVELEVPSSDFLLLLVSVSDCLRVLGVELRRNLLRGVVTPRECPMRTVGLFGSF